MSEVQETIKAFTRDGKLPPEVATVLTEFGRCKGWLEPALRHGGNTHALKDILLGILRGSYQLWPAENSVVVTEILEYPRRRVINYFLAGGNLKELREMRESVEAWAIANGCDGAILTGRKGWVRSFLSDAGYDGEHVTMTKEFGDVDH